MTQLQESGPYVIHRLTPPPSGGVRFGRFELLRRIGAGGMGEVWVARLVGFSGIDKLCVVKRMLPHLSEDQLFVRRFLDEAKVVVHLAHGNIAQVFEMGQEDGQYFMAMEYVEGKTLGKIVQRLRGKGARFPLNLALYVGIRLCDALAYAHHKTSATGRALHLVHRDISPSNILISYDGEVKVIDFGVAQSTLKEAQTAPRVVIGNLAYMSPEQARKAVVDHRADIYSASVVLWELVGGQKVALGGDAVERWRRAANPKFEPPSHLVPEVSADLDRVIMRGLSPRPADRPQNADALRDDLQRCLAELGPQPNQSSLAALMRQCFADEAAAERRMVADALDPDRDDTIVDPGLSSVSSHTDLELGRALRSMGGPGSAPSPRGLPVDARHTPAERPNARRRPAGSRGRGSRPSPLEQTGDDTQTFRRRRRSLKRGLVLAAAFLMGLALALLVYRHLMSPPRAPASGAALRLPLRSP